MATNPSTETTPAGAASAVDYAARVREASRTENAPRLALTRREACAALGISETSIWRLEARGLLRPVKHLRHRLYAVKEIERFLAA
jgi:hypothetical protein